MVVKKLPPVSGMFRRRFFFNLGGSLTVGSIAAYMYWYYSYVPFVNARTKLDMDLYNEYIAAHPEHGKI
ncbi:hypothetical protein HMI56_006993 [Coelomomyces lativittatus]|nr:hypothetical protein HMI56_006993 [Coelomomyces lativittatus]